MHPAKRFFYVSLGILALAGAFHLGARSAQGQSGSTIVGITTINSGSWPVAIAANGDCYIPQNFTWSSLPWQFVYAGNVFSSGPIPTIPTTWGRIKAERR